MKKRIVAAIGVLLALAALGLIFRIVSARKDAKANAFRITYLDSNYEGNPEKADWIVPRDEDGAFLGGILETVLEGEGGLSDEAKGIRILKYVSSSLTSKANQGSATKTIHDGFALCGGKSLVFVTLCREAGMAARYVGSMYMPELRSHAISEVFYDGKWHLYDPTFGIFFYSNPDYDNTGYVISFHDLVSNPYGWTPFKVVSKAGTGRYDESVKTFAITKVAGDYLTAHDDESLDSYRKDVNEAYPVAYGGDDMVSYPVDANLLENASQWFGQRDDRDGELATYAVRFSGSHYVGNGVPPAFHTWVVKASPHTTVSIEYYSVNHNPPKLYLVPLRAVRVVDCKYEDEKVTFTVYINDSEAVLSVYCPGASFDVDAMHIYR
jgi:Transglutaminase-like superfamily